MRQQNAGQRSGAGHVSAMAVADPGGGVHSSRGFCGDFGGVDGGGWGDCGAGGGGGGDGGGGGGGGE